MSAAASQLSSLFDRWAPSYDEQPNPLIALEERVLLRLMPSVAGMDVLDVGCGTGRWLRRLELLSPHSLTGLDASSAMLARARARLNPATKLYLGAASSLPASDLSCDLILASFVLSYIDDLDLFAAECSRALRPDGICLLSDMHPDTASARGWTRSFHAGAEKIHLPAHHRSLDSIIEAFAQHGLQLCSHVAPSFGAAEKPFFERTGKTGDYHSLTSVPAIYLLRFRKVASAAHRLDLHLANAPWAADEATWNTTPLSTQSGRVQSLHAPRPTLDLSGYVLLPGLVNAHDHLDFALFPNLGRNAAHVPYRNATEWATEIHQVHASTIRQHLQVPLATRLWWGAIRNLLAGVTTVCHHNPHHAEFDQPGFPVRVTPHVGWSHSLTFSGNLLGDYRGTTPGAPFLLHAAEGTDATSRHEIHELDRLGLLDRNTVLIHGLALTEPEIALLNRRGVALILCPTSNDFLFARTLPPSRIAAIDRVALGSDSPLTAAGDLLDELQHLHHAQAVDAPALYRMVTTTPAHLLQLDPAAGTIAPGAQADLIAVRNLNLSPAETLAHLTFADIELVLLGGIVHAASPTLYARLPRPHREGLELLTLEGHRRYVRAPLAALFQTAEDVLGRCALRLGGKEVRHVPAP